MRLILGVLLFLAVFSCGCAAEKRQAAKVFGNMTYYVGNEWSAEPVTLINRAYHSLSLNISYDDKFVYGDFNHDGLKDAAVILEKNSGGSAYSLTLNFLINDGKKLIHKASRRLDDGIDINRISQRNGKVIIDMDVRQQGDWAAQPRRRVLNMYEYAGPDSFGLGAEKKVSNF